MTFQLIEIKGNSIVLKGVLTIIPLQNFRTTLGIYDFNDFIRFDTRQEHFLGPEYTVVHEVVHQILTANSLFGVCLYIIDNISWRTKESRIPLKKICKELMVASRKTQEGVATFIEFAMLKALRGDVSFKIQIRKLKKNNKEYFNYIKHLIGFLENKDWKEILISKLIFRIGLLALSIDLSQLPNAETIIKQPKKVRKVLEHPKYVNKFRPR